MSLRIFKSDEPNTFHYVTCVTNNRRNVFDDDEICKILSEVIQEIKQKHPFKLAGYVFMPDHIHMLLNPLSPESGTIIRKIKGKSGKLIIDHLKENRRYKDLKWLRIYVKNRKYAVWQTRSSDIDLISKKFFNQKLDYIHMNPVRGGLCENPEDWIWSSYRALKNGDPNDSPLEVDLNPYWTKDELDSL